MKCVGCTSAALVDGKGPMSPSPTELKEPSAEPSTRLLLTVSDLSTGYIKGVPVVEQANLRLNSNEVLGILGANGAGKTSLLRAITGSLPAWKGSVRLGQDDITSMKPQQVVGRGVGVALEGRRIFTSLTVEENLCLPLSQEKRSAKPVTGERLKEIYDVMPDLYRHRRSSGGALSGGQQQMLAIGRALICRPRLLILDEPSLGLSPRFVEQIVGLLRSVLERFDIGILLAEQILWMAKELATTVQLMEAGVLGAPQELASLDTAAIANAYLGGATEANVL